jgi:O-methyltransferase
VSAGLPFERMGLSEQYLELLKRSLTRSGFGDAFATYEPPLDSRIRRGVLAAVRKVLHAHELELVKRVEDSDEAREHGLMWPLTGETMVGRVRLDNVHDCIRIVMADRIPGDFIETGCWRGGVAIFMRGALLAYGDGDRTVWAADSFEGLPKPDSRYPADEGDLHWTKPDLVATLTEVKENFRRYGLLDEQVRFLVGWFADTLPEAPIAQLALLRLDGDMYGSTMDALTALEPRLVPGGFLIVDDYGLPGCRAAVDDYRVKRGIVDAIRTIEKPDSPHGRPAVFWRKGGI